MYASYVTLVCLFTNNNNCSWRGDSSASTSSGERRTSREKNAVGATEKVPYHIIARCHAGKASSAKQKITKPSLVGDLRMQLSL